MNPYGKKNIAGNVWDLIEPPVEELGYRLWNVEYVREGADMYLRITIDSDNGIAIDDCEKVTRAVDPIIDEADPIDGSYYLEVSSPGVERVLTVDDHFERMAGSEVEIKLYRAMNGSKSLRGILVGRDSEAITLKCGTENESEEIRIPTQDAARVTTVFDWQSEMKGQNK